MGRTDHSKAIADFRYIADNYDTLSGLNTVLKAEEYRKDALAARAAADLLEIHDATGLNLHAAPNLLAFVEGIALTLIGPLTVEDNGA